MRTFVCTHCSTRIFFGNSLCGSCGSTLGYDPAPNKMFALDRSGDDWVALAPEATRYRLCQNAAHDVCNWLVPVESPERFCAACRHNHLIPDLTVPDNPLRWQRLETAKHHLFYSLLRLRLPLETRGEQPEYGLSFEFLADNPDKPDGKVLTGHNEGIITLNLVEADDAVREQRRTQMGEPYRTLLGHFRHEIGHYYWDRLVRDTASLEACRACFGDESVDYNEALKKYYAEGAPPDWRDSFISAYSTSHPWEDFAETWAHYLHIVDTLEMAGAYGLRVDPRVSADEAHRAAVDFDPHRATDINQLVSQWAPITVAINSINRCMGQPDLYPFVLTPVIIGKLGFIHNVIHPPN